MKYVPPYGRESEGDSANYVNGDPSIARQGSIIPADAVEHPQREIVKFIENSDQIPTDGDLEQLTKGIRNQWVNFCVDTGSINSLSVALTPALTEYKQGTPLRVLVANNNTGPCTINVNSLGNRPVKRSNGAQLESGDIRTGMVALLVDDGTSFQVMNYLGATGGAVNNYMIDIPYAEDTALPAAPNNILVNYGAQYGAVPAVAGDVVLVRVANANTGAVTIKINSLSVQPLRRNDGMELLSQDLLEDECILIEYNVTHWQMLRLVRSQVFLRLSADLILHVHTAGNDVTGDGNIARPFKSVERAVEFVRQSFLIAGRTVTIQLDVPGTYVCLGTNDSNIYISNLPGSLVIRGDPANPLNYVLQGHPSVQWPVITVTGAGAALMLTGVTISIVYNNGGGVASNYGSSMALSEVHFTGVTAWNYISTVRGSISCSGNIHFWSNAKAAFALQSTASLVIGLWNTVITCHGSYFSNAFIYCEMVSNAWIAYPYCTFAGGATGIRFASITNSVILTQGGANYLPGNQPGVTDASGVYV